METKSIREEINELKQLMENPRKKQKQFKLPLGIRASGVMGAFKKQNKIIVQIIKANGSTAFTIAKIEDNTVKVKDNIYDASAGHILRYKKYPLLIIPEWNIKPISPESKETRPEPFNPKENMEKAAAEGTLTAAEKLIITKMKMEAVSKGMQLNWKVIFILLAVGAAAIFALDYFKII